MPGDARPLGFARPPMEPFNAVLKGELMRGTEDTTRFFEKEARVQKCNRQAIDGDWTEEKRDQRLVKG